MNNINKFEVEWLNGVPTNWNKLKLKYLCKINTGSKDTQDKLPDGKYPFFVRSPHIESLNEFTHDEEAIMTAGDGVGVGKVFHHYEGKFAAHQRVYVFTEFKNVIGKYLYYYLISNLKFEVLMGGAKSTVDSIRRPMLSEFPVVFPDKLDQQKIVQFLDKKEELINNLIQSKEEYISLLEEQRQSIITEAVTKGLNPNVKMKDSGVEWIGKIPEHWELKQIRRIVKDHRQGYYSENGYVDEGYKLIRITDLRKDNTIDFSQSPSVGLTKVESKNFSLLKGDFLFARTGGAGSFGLVETDLESITYASYLIRFRFKEEMITPYLKNFFLSESFLSGVKTSIHGGVNQNIHAEDIKKQFICVPPKLEQLEIGEKLEKESAKIATVIMNTIKQIEVLKEYRQALIYEAVTGKIDVRDMELD